MHIFPESADKGLSGCSRVVGAKSRKWGHFGLVIPLPPCLRSSPTISLWPLPFTHDKGLRPRLSFARTSASCMMTTSAPYRPDARRCKAHHLLPASGEKLPSSNVAEIRISKPNRNSLYFGTALLEKPFINSTCQACSMFSAT